MRPSGNTYMSMNIYLPKGIPKGLLEFPVFSKTPTLMGHDANGYPKRTYASNTSTPKFPVFT